MIKSFLQFTLFFNLSHLKKQLYILYVLYCNTCSIEYVEVLRLVRLHIYSSKVEIMNLKIHGMVLDKG